MNFRRAIGQIIRADRTKARITQREFGEAVGSTQSAWAKVENGEAGLPVSRFVRVCELLKADPSEIVNRAKRLRQIYGSGE